MKTSTEDPEIPYELCLAIAISEIDKSISLEYLNNCGIKNGGIFFIDTLKDFAKKYGYKSIDLHDVSTLYFYGENQTEVTVSLKQMKLLKEGISWYGKQGFTDKFYNENKNIILDFINSPTKSLIGDESFKQMIEFIKKINNKKVKENISISETVNELENYIKKLDCRDSYKICLENDIKNIITINLIINYLYNNMLKKFKWRDENIN